MPKNLYDFLKKFTLFKIVFGELANGEFVRNLPVYRGFKHHFAVRQFAKQKITIGGMAVAVMSTNLLIINDLTTTDDTAMPPRAISGRSHYGLNSTKS